MLIFMNDSRKNLLLLRNYADFKLSFMNNANSNAINEDIGNELQQISHDFTQIYWEFTNKFNELSNRLNCLTSKFRSQSQCTPKRPKNKTHFCFREESNKKYQTFVQSNKNEANLSVISNFTRSNLQLNDPIKNEPNTIEVDFLDEDLLKLEPITPGDLDQTNFDDILEEYAENSNALWSQFREIEESRIRKAHPKESAQLIDQFIQKKWNTLTHKEREAEVANYKRKKNLEMSRAKKKQQIIEHNENVKNKFQDLLNKRTKREIITEKIALKKNDSKIFANDLRDIIENSKMSFESKNTVLENRLKKIFQS